MDRDAPEYRQLDRTVKKAIRRDLRAHNTRMIHEAIEDNMNMRVLRSKTTNGKLLIHKMKNEHRV